MIARRPGAGRGRRGAPGLRDRDGDVHDDLRVLDGSVIAVQHRREPSLTITRARRARHVPCAGTAVPPSSRSRLLAYVTAKPGAPRSHTPVTRESKQVSGGARCGRAGAMGCHARHWRRPGLQPGDRRRGRGRAHETGRLVGDARARRDRRAAALHRGHRRRAAARDLGGRRRGVEQPCRGGDLVHEAEVEARTRRPASWPAASSSAPAPPPPPGRALRARPRRAGSPVTSTRPMRPSPCTITRRSHASAGSQPPARKRVAVDGPPTTCGSVPSRSMRGVGAGELGDARGRQASSASCRARMRESPATPGVRRPRERVGHRCARAPRRPRRSRRGGVRREDAGLLTGDDHAADVGARGETAGRAGVEVGGRPTCRTGRRRGCRGGRAGSGCCRRRRWAPGRAERAAQGRQVGPDLVALPRSSRSQRRAVSGVRRTRAR